MGDVDPTVPQVNDPELEADLIRALSIVGQIGKLRVVDIVIPTISLGNVIQQTVEVVQPSFRSTDVFSNGLQTAPAINTILADTGALAAGIYDVGIQMAGNDTAGAAGGQLEHRNAANTANLANWDHLFYGADVTTQIPFYSFGYELELNERLRVRMLTAGVAGRSVNAVIFARLRT